MFAQFALGCASILGIDDQYVMQSAPAPTGGAAGMNSGGGGGAGGAAGSQGSGGVPLSTGGTAPNGSGGVLPEDAGCDGACDTGDCRPGHYTGTFTGQHDPVNLVQGIPIFDVTGAVEFDVEADSKGQFVVSGTFALGQQTSLVAQFSATIEGVLDCGTAELDAKLTGGNLALFLLPPFEFKGSLDGSYDSTARTVSGGWSENQIPATQATGSGTWTATWVRP